MRALAAALLALSSASMVLGDTTIREGVPVQDAVGPGEYAYFTWDRVNIDQSVTFNLNAIYGDPDMYIACAPHPTQLNAVWKSTEIGNETITLSPPQLSAAGCYHYVYISVVGGGVVPGTPGAASFIISVQQPGIRYAVSIQPGESVSASAAGVTVTYLQYQVAASDSGQLEISKTDLFNEADIYVQYTPNGGMPTWPQFQCDKYSGSTGYCLLGHMQSGTFDASTVQTGGSAIVFPAAQVTQGNFFAIGMVCKDQTSWCIAAVSIGFNNVPILLTIGPSQYFTLSPNSYQQFVAYIAATADSASPELVVNARNLWGGAYLYASQTPGPSNTTYTWSGVVGPRDVQLAVPFGQLSVPCQKQINMGGNCSIYIALQASSYLPDSFIAIQAGIGGSSADPLLLEPGQSINVDAPAQTFTYILSQLNIPGTVGWTVSAELNSGSGDVWIVLGTGRRFYPQGAYDVHSPFIAGESVTYFSPTQSQALVQSVPPSDSELGRLRAHRCTKELFDQEAPEPWQGSLQDLADVRSYVEKVLALPDGADCPKAPLRFGLGYYCSSCEVRITIKSGIFGIGTTVSLVVDNSTDITPLQLEQPVPGVVGPQAYQYFALTVNLETPLPIQLTLERISGDPDLYISVQDPQHPYVLPTRSAYSWRSLGVGTDILDINPGTPGYTARGTYLIGVYGASWSSDSEFNLLAQAGTQSMVRDLPEDQYQYAAIQSGQYVFFMFDPCGNRGGTGGNGNGCGPGVSPNVTFNWASLTGTVSLFITNSYRPGMAAMYLPTKDSNLPVKWSITDGVSTSFTITPATTGYSASKQLYTIGILSSSLFGSSVSIQGTVSIPDVINIINIQPGLPSGPYTVAGGTNTFFMFEYSDLSASKDIFIGVDAVQGAVDLVVAPPQATRIAQAWAPRCSLTAHAGNPVLCLGWLFKSTAAYGTQVGISHLSPCEPLAGPAPNSNCSVNMFRGGQWLATVFAESPATFTISATLSDDHLTLMENAQLDDATALVTVCQNRDLNSGICPQNSGRQAYASWLFAQLNTGGTTNPEDVQIVFDQECMFGGCGADLHVYATSCYTPGNAPTGAATCGTLHPFPSAEFHQLYTSIQGGSGSLRIPSNTPCGPTITWNGNNHDVWNDDNANDDWSAVALPGALNQQAPCQWFFGVFSGSSHQATSAGKYATYSVTLTASNDNDIQVVSAACTRIGQTCPLPPNLLAADTPSKYFDVEFNVTQTVAVTISAIACQGIPTLYACEPGSGCANPTHPSSGTKGASQIGTFDQNTLAATISFRSFPYSTAYVGVTVSSGGSNPSFQLQVTHGSSPTLIAPSFFTARFDNQGVLQVQWNSAMLYFPGQQATQVSTASEVFVFDVTTAQLPTGSQLGTNCGLEAAFAAMSPAGTATRTKFPISFSSGAIPGLNPSHKYYVGLMVACGNGCVPPSQAHELRVASTPVFINAGGQSPSPLPTPPPAGNSPSPSPSPTGGMSGGAVAGIVIGTLAGVGAAGGFIFYRMRNPAQATGDMGYYEAPDL
jgi:hypothetical protein